MTRIIAVLGMHRSGTSCLTGMLEDAGIALGNVSRKNPHNLKGNNEDLRIVSLHDEVLAANGASWDAPPDGGCRWGAQQLRSLDRILADHATLPAWAFKDPRALMTLEGWIERVPELEYVGSFRHPAAVVDSVLSREGGRDFGATLELWAAYNRRLLAFQERFGFDLVCFDLPRNAYLDQLTRAFRRLRLHPDRGELRFFDDSLRTRTAAEDRRLPPHILSLYRRLQERAL